MFEKVSPLFVIASNINSHPQVHNLPPAAPLLLCIRGNAQAGETDHFHFPLYAHLSFLCFHIHLSFNVHQGCWDCKVTLAGWKCPRKSSCEGTCGCSVDVDGHQGRKLLWVLHPHWASLPHPNTGFICCRLQKIRVHSRGSVLPGVSTIWSVLAGVPTAWGVLGSFLS